MLTRREALQIGGLGLISLPFHRQAFGIASEFHGLLDHVDLGVASGDPDSSSVMLWTRLPLGARDQVVSGSVNVYVDVSTGPEFRATDLVIQDQFFVDESSYYNVKYLAEGLDPGTYYYYRFRTGNGYQSMVGRTKTLPDQITDSESLRIAVASCQQYFTGYYHAYRFMTENNYDFCVHLGDFIYEFGGNKIRSDLVANGRAVNSLEEFRSKYMLYLSDPALKKARAWFPWFYIWDDHEVSDNYSVASLTPALIQKKSQAYRCYQDFMPVRASLEFPTADGNPHLPLYRSVKIDDLCDIVITDLRQYRTPKNCIPGSICPSFTSPTILGQEQKSWFMNLMGSSNSVWKLVMNEVMFMPFKALSVPGLDAANASILNNFYLNRDGWDGFGADRKELTEFYHAEGIQNVVYCTGDIHNFYAGIIHRHPEDIKSEAVAYELITTSISSPGLTDILGRDFQHLIKPVFYKANPYVKYTDLKYHGYMDLTINRRELNCRFMAVNSVATNVTTAFELYSTNLQASTTTPSLSIHS